MWQRIIISLFVNIEIKIYRKISLISKFKNINNANKIFISTFLWSVEFLHVLSYLYFIYFYRVTHERSKNIHFEKGTAEILIGQSLYISTRTPTFFEWRPRHHLIVHLFQLRPLSMTIIDLSKESLWIQASR